METSIAAYHDPETQITVARQKDRICAFLNAQPGMTAGEIYSSGLNCIPKNNISTRLNEMERARRVHRKGLRKCAWSGKQAYIWFPGPNPEIPEGDEPGRRLTRKQLERQVQSLNEIIRTQERRIFEISKALENANQQSPSTPETHQS